MFVERNLFWIAVKPKRVFIGDSWKNIACGYQKLNTIKEASLGESCYVDGTYFVGKPLGLCHLWKCISDRIDFWIVTFADWWWGGRLSLWQQVSPTDRWQYYMNRSWLGINFCVQLIYSSLLQGRFILKWCNILMWMFLVLNVCCVDVQMVRRSKAGKGWWESIW